MKNVALLYASPNPAGVTSTLADWFCKYLARERSINRIRLCDLKISPCKGCNACRPAPHACILDIAGDKAEQVFSAMRTADFLIISSPIYFYSLPAQFKALIDRSQKYWFECGQFSENGAKTIPAAIILAGGRKKGKELFKGALNVLKVFFPLFNIHPVLIDLFRGLETPETLSDCQEYEKMLTSQGQKIFEMVQKFSVKDFSNPSIYEFGS